MFCKQLSDSHYCNPVDLQTMPLDLKFEPLLSAGNRDICTDNPNLMYRKQHLCHWRMTLRSLHRRKAQLFAVHCKTCDSFGNRTCGCIGFNGDGKIVHHINRIKATMERNRLNIYRRCNYAHITYLYGTSPINNFLVCFGKHNRKI